MKTTIRSTLMGVLVLAAASAQAQVIVHGTRVIFPGDQREVTVRLQNTAERAALVQTWTDDGNPEAKPETASTPFVLRPPVFRLDAGKSQVVRMQFMGAALPQDRESLYWFNALDIPPKPSADKVPSGNFLQFSVRTRIKIFYRPKGLTASAAAVAHEKVQWKVVPEGKGWALQASNPTPYYVNFSQIDLQAGGKTYPHPDIGMVPPLSTATFALQGLGSRPAHADVQYVYVTDQGANLTRSVPLSAP